MENILNKTTELLDIIDQKEKLDHRERELLRPPLADFSDIGLVHKIFTVIEKKPYLNKYDVNEEKKLFIFIVGVLFAPRILVGKRLPRDIRLPLSEVTNKDGSFISNSISEMRFRYQKSKAYQEVIDYLYNEIINELIISGKLQTI